MENIRPPSNNAMEHLCVALDELRLALDAARDIKLLNAIVETIVDVCALIDMDLQLKQNGLGKPL